MIYTILVVATFGCGRSTNIAKPASIEGVIKLDGKPLKSGYIQFLSTSTSDVGATPLNEDGSYKVEGLSIGDYDIQIGPRIVPPGAPPAPTFGQTIPKKYLSPATSGLKTTITPGMNQFDVSLE